MKAHRSKSRGKSRRSQRSASGSVKATPAVSERSKLDLSKIRHALRTPINHIIGYCEMLQEEEKLPVSFQKDLQRIHDGGRQLLSLISEYFDEEKFSAKRDLHQLYHELRTPVNHVIGYAEMLAEEAESVGRKKYVPDLQKIRDAALTWLALMEEHLIPPNVKRDQSAADLALTGPAIPEPGISFHIAPPKNAHLAPFEQGSLLIVDDDEANREMLARRLRRYGYTVNIATSGLEALRRLRAEKFDLALLDMIMPDIDGFQVLAKMKADATLQHVPVIMISALDQEYGIARCIELGAEDYLAKPFNPVFLRARIGACLEKKHLRDREQETYRALVESQKKLAAELAEAATYVKSLLPHPLQGAVSAEWCFHPSTQLGGDAFGYHWLDDNHFAIYLLDVCGHGVGAALLSVSVSDVLRSETLPATDFRNPAAVLASLNRTFKMENHNNMYFTAWYGVYNKSNRELVYASGGHPPAILVVENKTDALEVSELRTRAPAIGCFDDATFTSASAPVGPDAKLFVLSDGVYEVSKADGKMMTWAEFLEHLTRSAKAGDWHPARSLQFVQQLRGSETLEDDFSLVKISFN